MREIPITAKQVKAWPFNPSIRCVAAIICRHYGLTAEQLRTRRRQRKVVGPRYLAFWLARHLNQSFPEIGRRLGGFDHSTVIAGIRHVNRRRAADVEYRELSDQLLAAVLSDAEVTFPPPPPPPEIKPESKFTPHRHLKCAAPGADVTLPEGQSNVPFYGEAAVDERSRHAFLVEQNDRFCAAMRAAMGESEQ